LRRRMLNSTRKSGVKKTKYFATIGRRLSGAFFVLEGGVGAEIYIYPSLGRSRSVVLRSGT